MKILVHINLYKTKNHTTEIQESLKSKTPTRRIQESTMEDEKAEFLYTNLSWTRNDPKNIEKEISNNWIEG